MEPVPEAPLLLDTLLDAPEIYLLSLLYFLLSLLLLLILGLFLFLLVFADEFITVNLMSVKVITQFHLASLKCCYNSPFNRFYFSLNFLVRGYETDACFLSRDSVMYTFSYGPLPK